MEFKIWLAGQIAIDVFMFIILLTVLKIHLKKQLSSEDLRERVRQSEASLGELREIGLSLERNLDEKKELSQSLLFEMDKRLKEAKKVSEELREILLECRKGGVAAVDRNGAPNGESIRTLMAKGLTKEEISKYLNVPAGELELILKLRSQEGP